VKLLILNTCVNYLWKGKSRDSFKTIHTLLKLYESEYWMNSLTKQRETPNETGNAILLRLPQSKERW